jgi:macrolide-specific efflux system membrane fusion protein
MPDTTHSEEFDVLTAKPLEDDAETDRKGLPVWRNVPKAARGWVIAALVGLAAAAGWFLYSGSTAKKVEIVTATVTRGNLEQSVLATGVLEPFKLVSVGSQASGQVKKLYVELGQTVKIGDPIADIDARTQTNTVENASAGLSNVTAQKAAAEAALSTAKLNYDRQKRLYDAGAAAKADFDTATSTLAAAQAQVKAVNAQIRQANLTLNTAQTNLGYTKILAPMDGVIVAVITLEGQTVNANQSAPTIVKLAQLDKMTVNAQISEADVPKVTSGQTVYFTTLGDTRTRHYAKLRAVAPAPDSIASDSMSSTSSSSTAAVYYDGLFDVDNADGSLKTGMTAQVYVIQASARDTLIVPSSALQRKGGRGADASYTVKVLGADRKPVEKPVKIGINTNVSAQVLEGLNEGDKVVVAQATGKKTGAQGQQQRNPLAPSGPGAGGGRRGGGG